MRVCGSCVDRGLFRRVARHAWQGVGIIAHIAPHERIEAITIKLSTADTASDPKQPSRLLKKKNIKTNLTGFEAVP
jgi:hypothetical protein